jgi:hypothetical protein
MTKRLSPSRSVLSAVHGDRTVLLDLRRERYYSLDPVGTQVWALLKGGADVPAIVAHLMEEFDVSQERLEADVLGLLEKLSRLRVIESVETRPTSALVATVVLVGVTLALRILGLRRSLTLVRRFCGHAPEAEAPSPGLLADVVRKVDTAAVFFPGRALCLEQSLALYLCLRRAGVPVELRMGVQPYPFAAHAWVEYRGDPVGDSYDRVGKFAPFDGLGTSSCSCVF